MKTDRCGSTLLHWAAKNDPDYLQRFLARVSLDDIDRQDSLGRTPLHAAVMGHQPVSVQLLVDAGACVGTRDKMDELPENKTYDAAVVEILRGTPTTEPGLFVMCFERLSVK